MNYVQKVVLRLLGLKATGFPPWNSAGPWPQNVITGFGGGASVMNQLATVYGCVRVRGQALGALPWHVYREDANGERTKAIDHWLYPLLHAKPNPYQTSFEFRECMERSFCLHGNAYARKMRVGKRVTAIDFLPSDWVHIRWDQQKGLIYTYSAWGKSTDLSPDDVIHVKNFSENGLWGDSPLRNTAVYAAIEAQNYGRSFLQNLGRPGGYLQLETNRPTSDDIAARVLSDWQGIHGGTENAGKTAVLWKGSKYVDVPAATPDEGQYIETRNLSVQEIAGGIYGVPLNLIGHTDKTATYASAEHFDISFVKHTVRPQCERYEEAFNKALLASEPGVYCEMDLDALLRGDSAAQAAFYATVRSNAGMTSNEFRRKMNWKPDPDPAANELMQQSNMIPLKLAGQTTAMGGQGTQVGGDSITSQVKPGPAVRPVAGVKP